MKLTISVPKPCHENWEAMTPAAKGRHCEQCDHVVADLTRATDAELVALFTSDARPKCARFDPRQLDRVMSNEPPQRASAIPVAAFTSLLAVAAGSEALAQGPPLRTVGEVEIAPPERRTVVTITSGRAVVVQSSAQQVPGVKGNAVAITGDTSIVPQPDEIIAPIELGQPSIKEIEDLQPLETPERVREAYLSGFGPGVCNGGIVVSEEEAVDSTASAMMEALEDIEVITGGIPGTFGDDGVISDTVEVCGHVQDENGEPLPFITVLVPDHKGVGGVADENGDFKIKVPVRMEDELVVLSVHALGYEGRPFEVSLKVQEVAPPSAVIDAPLTPPIEPRDPQGVSGFVRDAATNKPIPNAVARIKGSAQVVRCDSEGRFFLKVREKMNPKDFELEIIDPNGGTQLIPLHAGAVPCCVPVYHQSAPGSDHRPNACIDAGVITMASMRDLMVLGGPMLVIHQTRWQRLTSPIRRTWNKLVR